MMVVGEQKPTGIAHSRFIAPSSIGSVFWGLVDQVVLRFEVGFRHGVFVIMREVGCVDVQGGNVSLSDILVCVKCAGYHARVC